MSDATEQLGNVGRRSDVQGTSNLERVLELVPDESQFLRAVLSRFDDDPEEPDVANDGDGMRQARLEVTEGADAALDVHDRARSLELVDQSPEGRGSRAAFVQPLEYSGVGRSHMW